MDVFTDFVEGYLDQAGRDGARVYPELKHAKQEAGDYTLGSLLDQQQGTLNSEQYLNYLAKKRNARFRGMKDVTDPKQLAQLEKELAAEVDQLKRTQINSADYRELAAGFNLSKPSLADLPGVGSVVKFTDAMTRLFKVGVLAWPARIARDFTSAMARSIESGMVDVSRLGHAGNSLQMGKAVALGDARTLRQ